MRKHEIRVGGLYLAKVAGKMTAVRVDGVRTVTLGRRTSEVFDVTNLRTGRRTTFRSAAKFRGPATMQERGTERECIRQVKEAALLARPGEGIEGAMERVEGAPPFCAGSESAPSVGSLSEGAECPSHDALGHLRPGAALGTPCTCRYGEEVSEGPDPTSATPGATATTEGEQSPDPTLRTSATVGNYSIPTASDSSGAPSATTRVQGATEGEQRDPFASGSASTAPETGSSTHPSSPVGAAATPAGATGGSVAGSLASRIAATRAQRVAGSPVAGMVPNEEQESILCAAVVPGLRVLVISAGAGTGKTATLRMLEQVLRGRGQYTAFNSSLVAESKAKFVRAVCNTTHSLAFRAVGNRFAHRLGGERMRSAQVARILGIADFTVRLPGAGEPLDRDSTEWCAVAEAAGYDEGNPPPDDFAPHADRVKRLTADFLAGQVLTAVRRFCQSADREVGAQHLRYIDGIDEMEDYQEDRGYGEGVRTYKRRSRANNDRVKEYLLPFCARAWADLSRVDGQLPFNHDCYVKIWQLGQGQDRPEITANYILLDEAQDTAPVFLDILRQQEHALLVFVGDSNQQIYEWRGAVDAMKAYPDAERRMLSQSYRFGQTVADVANAILRTLEEPTDLVMRGMPGIPSRVVAEEGELSDMCDGSSSPLPTTWGWKPTLTCYLYRTNAGALGRVMRAVADGKRPHLVGGKDYVSGLMSWCQAAMDLQARRGTRHPELACFETWAEVQEYSKTDEGEDLRLMVKLVDEFGAEEIRNALKDMPPEERADLVVSTAHKSKGREWDTVRLGPDFPTANKMSDPDRRLLYVAATRAKLVLDISECPPFCGGHDSCDTGDADTAGAWVPGLRIEYTAPMPSEADLASYLAARGTPTTPAVGRTPAAPANAPAPTQPAPRPAQALANGNVTEGEFTWANVDGRWCVRGPKDRTGQRVTVTRRNGSKSQEMLRTVVRKIGDLWFYEV